MAHYRNLVFKGGGVRGIAYLGALQYLYEHNYMQYVERVAGTSAGAITALGVSMFPVDYQELKRVADSLDYRKVPAEEDERTPKLTASRILALTERYRDLALFKNLQCSMRLVQEKGWYSSDYFYNWLRSIIEQRFTIKKETYTFADFKNPKIHKNKQPFLDLYITGTDVSNRVPRIFSFETTPDMEVALAVRISMSIPLYFETIEYQYPGTNEPQLYVDGGIMWNYPVNIFDESPYSKKLRDGINEETLGFFLFASPETSRCKPVKSMIEYVSALFESLLLVQEHLVIQSEKNFSRTIFIDDKGVQPTDFDIEPADERYKALFESGYSSASAFFEFRSEWSKFFRSLRERFGWKESQY